MDKASLLSLKKLKKTTKYIEKYINQHEYNIKNKNYL